MVVADVSAILHVDMDAFFVSCELVRRPELRGTPVIVGGKGRRGVVAAASYEARVYGIHSAMPSSQAQRLCPQAVFLDGDHALYSQVSARVMAVFTSFTPLVEPLSLDEAFLDVSGSLRLHGTPFEIAQKVRRTIYETESLTCSVGIAPNKFLAKLATNDAKPTPSKEGPVAGAGIKVIQPGGEQAFLDPLPAKALWGVGPATLAKLERLGVSTVRELAALPVQALVGSLGNAHGRHLHDLAHGRDLRRVEPDQKRKSVSHEETYPADIFDIARLHSEIVGMADAVGNRLRADAIRGRTVTLKVRYGSFETLTRSVTLSAPTDSGTAIARSARDLLRGIDIDQGVRLLGVGMTGLGDGPAAEQLSFDALSSDGEPGETQADNETWREAEEAVDDIRSRFGASSIGPASSLGVNGVRTKQRGQQQWGPKNDQ